METLASEMITWGKTYPVSVVSKRNADCTQHEFILRIPNEAPWDLWSLTFGDSIHNFRSSLDHAIYALAIAHGGQDPPADERILAFPITDGPCQFNSGLGRLGQLRRDLAIRTAIEGLQPYRRRNPPHQPALRLLREFDDIDKHRFITIARAVSHRGYNSVSGFPPGAHVEFYQFTGGPFVNGTVLFQCTISLPAPDVQMEGNFAAFPGIRHTLADGSSTDTGVDWLLKNIRDEVSFCLDTIINLVS